MKEFLTSSILGELARTLEADIALAEPGVFPCCPLVGRVAGGETVLARLKGPIGLRNRQEFQNALHHIVRNNPAKVILDLADASLSRSAMGVLLDFASLGHGRGKRLYLYRISAQIRSLLKELGLKAFFSYLETEDDVPATLVI